MEAVKFIVDTLLWLVMLAFALRLLFQLVRADFRDPLADTIVRATNWLILPLRRILPPIRKVDTATVVALFASAIVHSGALLALSGAPVGEPLLLARLAFWGLVELILRIYLFALLVYALMSYVSPGGYGPGVRLVRQLCEPLLKPVRRAVPPIGQIDFSVLWVSIAIGALLILLR